MVAYGTCDMIIKRRKIGWGAEMVTGRQNQNIYRSITYLYCILSILHLIYVAIDLCSDVLNTMLTLIFELRAAAFYL